MFWKNKVVEKKISQLQDVLRNSFTNVKDDTNKIFQWLNFFYEKNQQYEQQIIALKQELSATPKTKEELKMLLDEHYSYEAFLEKINGLDQAISELKNSKLENSHLVNYVQKLDHNLQISMHHNAEERTKITQKIDEIEQRLSALKSLNLEENSRILQRINDLDSRLESLKKQPPEVQKQPRDLEDIKMRIKNLEQKKSAIKEKIIKRITKNSKEYVKTIMLSYIKKYEKISALQLKEMVVEEQGLCSKSSFYRILEEIEKEDDIATLRKGKEKHYMAKKLKLQ